MKSEFTQINLSKVAPKLCFKNLKGMGSSKLSSLTPIAPIIKIDRDDPRFVSHMILLVLQMIHKI